ncbi:MULTISPECIES: serine protease [unclassified Herbaspirillum]|nr:MULTISPECIES: serine protease [unclassified Herbaspirillum]MBB5393667.1 S1-C subfamily serine protease [Herbaspirillum sp. SJZ102]TQK03587.1 trypsin-like peptidase [Herbaspirillum sp. SJZ130]TQK08319.1 trypsin-like peptidase [Herbaspirillum sp. SJZ106]
MEAPDGRVVIGAELNDLITVKHSFAINADKTRLSNRARRMEVTGLTINENPNVRRIFIDRIRGALRAWETHGYNAAQSVWQAKVAKSILAPHENKIWKRQTRTGSTPQLRNSIWGKLLYLKMVRGGTDPLYNHLAERYNAVVEIEKSLGTFVAPRLPVDPVVRDERGARKAVFVVEWFGDFELSATAADVVSGQGTAFAYRESNLLITCDHLFEATATIKDKSYPADINAPEIKNLALFAILPDIPKKTWPVRILYRNAYDDIAILCFEGEPPPHKYFNPMSAPITRNTNGILMGYPAYKQWNLPDFNRQSVLNRFLPAAGMSSFTITGAGSIRPGNSGGPFTDLEYRVAGMAQRGSYEGRGHDACLCFEIIDKHLQKWKASTTLN